MALVSILVDDVSCRQVLLTRDVVGIILSHETQLGRASIRVHRHPRMLCMCYKTVFS